MTGTSTAVETAFKSLQSNPLPWPSSSKLVNKISPAPKLTPFFAHSTASNPVRSLPLLTTTSHSSSFPSRRFASIANTVHCLPTTPDNSVKNAGRRTAAVLMETLSAPAFNSFFAASTSRIPPPTVNGKIVFELISRTVCIAVARPSGVADISNITSSSAPCRSYSTASSTGSPASLKP